MREKKIGIYLMQRQRRITPLQCGIYHSFQARTLAEGEKASLQKVPPAEGVYFSQRGISSFTLGSGYAGLGDADNAACGEVAHPGGFNPGLE